MPRSSASGFLYGAYMVDAQFLKNLDQQIRLQTGCDPLWSVHLTNNSAHNDQAMEGILSNIDLEMHSVTSLSVEANGNRMRVAVGFSRGTRPIVMSVYGDDPVLVGRCRDDLLVLLKARSTWWSILLAPLGKQNDFSLIWPTLITTPALGGFVLSSYWLLQGQRFPSWSLAITAQQLFALAVITAPHIVFMVGRGDRRWKKLASAVKFLFGSVIAGSLINWISSIWNPFAR